MRRVYQALAAVGIALYASFPHEVLACAVCYGASDTTEAQGINMAVLFLLGTTGLVLASFGALFMYLMVRARRVPPLMPRGAELPEGNIIYLPDAHIH